MRKFMAYHHLHLSSLFLLLLLHILFSSASASIFISIDCGASEPYVDEKNISWETDSSYILNGKNQVVPSSSTAAGGGPVLPKQLSTLRVFSSRNKNCYPISIDGGGKILVRVTFYYGNYDKKSSPPSFALQFDANNWVTLSTSMDEPATYEAIYNTNGNGTSVCVAQTMAGQLPFVSSIEVRTLNNSYMYADVVSGLAFFLRSRGALGAPDIVRYPSDAYDRIWTPQVGLIVLKNETSIMDSSTVPDDPPVEVLMNAFTTSDVSKDLTLKFIYLPSFEVPVYTNLYFAESTELRSNDNRSFQIYVDDKKISDTISLTYQSALEYSLYGNASANTTISLRATEESTLPPAMSAIEIFIVQDGLSNGTDVFDLETLSTLQQQFDVLNDWSGDPCLPEKYNWDWVRCSSDTAPRVTALYLSGFGLSGSLPDFSDLDALQTIDMSNNSINGSIPDFLGKLPDLIELNLADNSLSGAIPSTLSSNKKIKLETSGNPKLCGGGQSCNTSDDTPSVPHTTNSLRRNSASNNKKKIFNLGVILGAMIPLLFI